MASQEVEREKSYRKIARLHAIIGHKNLKTKQVIIENILDSEGDINYPIPTNEYFKYKEPELIGSTILHVAIKKSDLQMATSLVKHGAYFTAKDIKGCTVLHLVIEKAYQKSKRSYKLNHQLEKPFIDLTLSLHIQSKNSTNPSNQFGLSHFHVACIVNNSDAIKFFLHNGAVVNERINLNSLWLPGYTPLHLIAKYGNAKTMKILLDYGADIHLRDAQKITALEVLIERNLKAYELVNMGDESSCQELKEDIEEHEKMINLILEKSGISQQDSDNKMGLTYFHIVCNLKSHAAIEPLLKPDLDLEGSVSSDSPLWPGYTALHFASHCNINTVNLLLTSGANILTKDAKGVTPFDLCLRYFKKEISSIIRCQTNWKSIVFSDGQTILSDFIDTVLDDSRFYNDLQTMDVNMFIPLDSSLWPGYTPLHLITLLFPKSIDTLDFYDDIKKLYRNLYKECRRQYSRWSGKLEHLLSKNADVTIQDINGSTPLHRAFELGRRDTAMRMMQYHEKTNNPVNKDGLSHLHIACASCHEELVERLLVNGVDANTQVRICYKWGEHELCFNSGSTPLHMNVIMDDDAVLDLLLAHGADLTVEDIHGLTPIHYFLNLTDPLPMYGEILTSLDPLQDHVTSFGLSYLHVASHLDNTHVINKLIDSGANIEVTIRLDSGESRFSTFAKFSGYTPLHLAMAQLNTSAMEVLIDRGADPFAKLPDGSMPIYNVFKLHPRAHYDEGNGEQEDEFISALFNFEAVQQRMEQEIGMTALHIACCVVDVDKVKEALARGIDADARIKADSPVWPNSTPMQVLCTNRIYFPPELSDIVGLLLDHGADVTLQNANLESPIHGMRSLCYHNDEFHELDMAFNGQKDFSVNPIDANGFSHFHLACLNNQLSVVEKFIEQGVDVNCSTDYFFLGLGGYTPLHFAAFHQFKEMAKLLLRHGADVHAQDNRGNTPLHVAANKISPDEEFFTILIDAGADVNAKNVYGETPFQIALNSMNITNEIIELFLKHGCSINLFNTTSQEGYIAIGLLSKDSNESFHEKAVFKELTNYPRNEKYQLDDVGRTPIHNVVSIDLKRRISLRQGKISKADYIMIINCLTFSNFNINYQDSKGQTALHYAVHFGNYEGVIGLLQNGADINIADENRLSPFAYACRYSQENSESHGRVAYELTKHLQKLWLYEIYISDLNKAMYIEPHNSSVDIRAGCFEEELRLAEDQIDSHHLTAYDFLSDTGAVAAYPIMLPARRACVNRYFRLTKDHHIKYPNLAEVLKVQFNKALTRVHLLKRARMSLKEVVKFELPDVCVDAILRLLPNQELTKLISMTNVAEPPSKRRKLD